MPKPEPWETFQAIAGLHIVWRHPLVRAARMSGPTGQVAQQASDHEAAACDLGRAHRQNDAPPAHQAGTGDAHGGQGAAGLCPVEADGEGVQVFHGATIPSAQRLATY